MGDPAFDVPPSCLNHLLLKCLPRPREAAPLRQAFDAFVAAYFARAAAFESRAALEARGRPAVAGACCWHASMEKSPVEYVSEEADRERVRAVGAATDPFGSDAAGASRRLLARPISRDRRLLAHALKNV